MTDVGFQGRVAAHVAVVTEGDPTDVVERRDRFGEESLELQQSLGQSRQDAHALVDYVHDRPVGEPSAELGGTMYTLAALSNQVGLEMAACGDTELARVSTPEVTARIRRKRAGRHDRGPLPGVDGGLQVSAMDAFAAGATARAAGRPRGSCPHGDEDGPGRAWRIGWSACDCIEAAR